MSARAASADELTTLVERLPANTCLAVGSRNIAASCAAFQQTQFGRQVSGPAFGPLVTELHQRDQPSSLHLRPWFGFDWQEIAQVKGAGVLAAFPLKDESAGVVWLLHDETARTMLRKSVGDYFAGKKWRAVESKATGATITTFQPPAGAAGTPRVWFEGTGFYGVADSTAAVEMILATKADASLATLPAGKSLVEISDQPADAHFFVQPLVFWKTLKAGEKLRLKDPLLVAERMGLGGITAASGSLVIDAKSGQWDLEADLVVPQPYPKALKALEMLPGPAVAAPDWVSDDVSSISTWRWDFLTSMDAFGHLFDEMSDPGPDGEGLFEQVLEGLRDDPEGPMVDLRKELFALLGPEVMSVKRNRHVLNVVNIAPKHAKAVNDFMFRFYKNDEEIVHEKIGTFEVWTGKDGAPVLADGEDDGSVTVRAIALGNDRLWLATDTAWLKEVIPLAAKGEVAAPLVKSQRWKDYSAWRAKAESAETAFHRFTNPAIALAPAYDEALVAKPPKATKGTASDIWRFLLFGTTDPVAPPLVAAAPKFASWGAEFPPDGLMLSQTKSGWRARLRSPAKP